MGFFDLPAPVFGFVDQLLSGFLPGIVRLVLWGILAGWLTMVFYRRLSNQEKIAVLKVEQKKQQKIISDFDGEFEELFPVIRHTLGLGMRQLGLSLGPALLATIPILFVVVWVAGEFAYDQPAVGSTVSIDINPVEQDRAGLMWNSDVTRETDSGWTLTWPAAEQPAVLLHRGESLLELPAERNIPVIHKHQWWNWLMANPIGYLEDDAVLDSIDIGLPEQQFLSFGPNWLRGWMFSFFFSFLLASIGFKLVLKID